MKTIYQSIKSLTYILTILFILVSTLFNFPAQQVFAQQIEPQSKPGELDSSFGSGGKATNSSMVGLAVIIQKSGKIVVAGFGDAQLQRFNSNGTPDPTFGNNGSAPKLLNAIEDITQQADGKILVAGTFSDGGDSDFGLARYLEDGTPDKEFGVKGRVSTDFFGQNDSASAVAVQSDGNIVIGGRAATSSGFTDFALARYTASGQPDNTFGVGGKVNTVVRPNISPSSKDERIGDIAIDEQGRIIAVGVSQNRAAYVCYQTNGLLDSTFKNGGKVVFDMDGSTSANSVAIQKDGRIVIGGSISNNSFDFMIARMLSDGNPDSSFGVGGLQSTDFYGKTDVAHSLTLLDDGRILQVGANNNSGANDASNKDFALVCYTADGKPDNTFGEGGKVTTDFANNYDEAYAVAINPNGYAIVIGRAGASPIGPGLGLARYVLSENAFTTVPQIEGVSIKKKQLIVTGKNFEAPTEIYINGEKQKKVVNDEQNPATTVIALKAGRFIAPGQMVMVQVRNSNTGITSAEVMFTRSLE